jgi:hypothetical protein
MQGPIDQALEASKKMRAEEPDEAAQAEAAEQEAKQQEAAEDQEQGEEEAAA